jgi:hypothetical protein
VFPITTIFFGCTLFLVEVLGIFGISLIPDPVVHLQWHSWEFVAAKLISTLNVLDLCGRHILLRSLSFGLPLTSGLRFPLFLHIN